MSNFHILSLPMSKINGLCGKTPHDVENVENHPCGLESESDSKNLTDSQSQLWKSPQSTVNSGEAQNLTQ